MGPVGNVFQLSHHWWTVFLFLERPLEEGVGKVERIPLRRAAGARLVLPGRNVSLRPTSGGGLPEGNSGSKQVPNQLPLW